MRSSSRLSSFLGLMTKTDDESDDDDESDNDDESDDDDESDYVFAQCFICLGF